MSKETKEKNNYETIEMRSEKMPYPSLSVEWIHFLVDETPMKRDLVNWKIDKKMFNINHSDTKIQKITRIQNPRVYDEKFLHTFNFIPNKKKGLGEKYLKQMTKNFSKLMRDIKNQI